METFNLDEYVGLPAGHEQSYLATIRREFTDAIGLPPERVHGPDPTEETLATAGERYEAAIVAAGGIEVQILGIGSDGHLAFNEPGSSLDLKHRVELHARLKSLAAERGMGIVMTTHDFDLTAAHATHVLLLRQGRTISYGDTATVMTEANLSAAFETPLTRVESRGSIGFLPIP